MKTVGLGISGLEVSRIAFGTWQLGGEWGKFDEREAIDAIQYAREHGVTLFDTAQAYGFGSSEQLLGQALRNDLDHSRDEVVIATKGGLRIDEQHGLVRDSSPRTAHGGDGRVDELRSGRLAQPESGVQRRGLQAPSQGRRSAPAVRAGAWPHAEPAGNRLDTRASRGIRGDRGIAPS